MRRALRISIPLAGFLLTQTAVLFLPPAFAGEGWKTEFETVCGLTDAAMTLKNEELKGLIARCDKLKSSIESEDETVRKVYLKRLKSCRDLYLYVLESREQEIP